MTRLRVLPLVLLASLAPACREAVDPTVIRLNGRIEATMVDLSPKVTGRVREVLVREGDRVKAGDVLVRLDLGDTALSVARDKSTVAAAEARVRDLEAGSRRPEIAAQKIGQDTPLPSLEVTIEEPTLNCGAKSSRC